MESSFLHKKQKLESMLKKEKSGKFEGLECQRFDKRDNISCFQASG